MTNANEPAQQSGGLPAAESRYAITPEEAESRSQKYRGRDVDPFPEIPPALLSSEHIKAYRGRAGAHQAGRDSQTRPCAEEREHLFHDLSDLHERHRGPRRARALFR